MPELPEVETIVRQLRPRLVGRRILGAELLWRRTLLRPSVRAFRERIAGRRIERCERRGKFFVFALEGGLLLVGHLRMTGRLLVQEGGEDPGWARLRLLLDDGATLFFTDVRKFGRVALVDSFDEIAPDLGPEPLGDEVDARWMMAALRGRRRRLKPLLLDQTFLAGLGNIYVDESLHRAGLHPLQLSHRVGAPAAAALTASIRAVLQRAIVAEGSSFDAFYRTPEGRPGGFQDEFAVYGREGEPCRRCGAAIVRIVVGQRGTHLCRRCQPRRR